MKRWEIVCALIGLLLAPFAISWEILLTGTQHVREEVIPTRSCRVTATIRYNDSDWSGGTAIILHGLSANRRLMEPVAQWMYASRFRAYSLDMPGHGDSDEPFSFARAEQCAAEAVSAIASDPELHSRPIVLIGHSTGAGIVIRLADRFDAAATIAISPAPLTPQPGPFADATPFTLPHRLPANLLVFIASLDPWPIRDSAKEWVARAGGTRDSDADFAARRALRLTDVPRANHTSLLVDARVARETADWIQRALHLERRTPSLPAQPFAFAVALLGLFLLFPAAATLLLGRAPLDSASGSAVPPLPIQRHAYAFWAIASLLAVLILKFWIPLRPLGLFSGDYLASFLLLVGLFALAFLCKQAGCSIFAGLARGRRVARLKSEISDLKSPSLAPAGGPPLATWQAWGGVSWRGLLASIFLAFAFFLAASWLFSWQLSDVWLNEARWLRFPWLLLPMLAYALAEELALGPPRPGRGDVWWRLARALTLRLILLAAMVAALLLLASNQILIPLLAHFMLLFSVCQRLGADAIRRRTGSALSAAVFSAILAAWYIAAVFPLL